MHSLFIQCRFPWEKLNPQTSFFPAHCLKLSPTPCCFTWFHNTALSVCVEHTQEVTVGVAVPVRSLLNTTGERIVILSVPSLPAIPVSCLPLLCRPEKRQVIHYSFSGVRSVRQQPAKASMQEEVGQLSSTVALLFLGKRNVLQLSLGPACAGLSDMVL